MSLERHYSLRAAARELGIDRHTLKAWLAADLAMDFPAVPRGSKVLIREADLAAVVRRRAPQSNFAKRRQLLASLSRLHASANAGASDGEVAVPLP